MAPTSSTAGGRHGLPLTAASLGWLGSFVKPRHFPFNSNHVNIDPEWAGHAEGFTDRFQGELLDVVRRRGSGDNDQLASQLHPQVADPTAGAFADCSLKHTCDLGVIGGHDCFWLHGILWTSASRR